MVATANDLVESGQLAEPPKQGTRVTSVELSRKIAVQRIFLGGTSVVAGAVLFAVENALPGLSTSFSMQMAAMGLGGLGLVQLGRAAKHLLKYGSRASVIGFFAAAGLGLSAASIAVLQWIGMTLITGPNPALRWAVHWLGWGFYGFGIVLLLVVLRALIGWAVDSSGLFREEVADA